MPIKFFNEDLKFQLKGKNILKKWITDTILSEKQNPGNINFIFTSNKYLLKLNKEYLSHNYYTDIVTFDYCEKGIINGDIFISIETVQNNSTRFNVSFKKELNRVVIHGILHLLGYDDQNNEEKAIMREKENYYLDRLENLF